MLHVPLSSLARAPAAIMLRGVTKRFGIHAAVQSADLDIRPGEFFSLLGPSGCGKTTTLRMIAGFETPDEGRIVVGDRDLTHMPVHQRDMGMVFQSYALLPHRTVAENVAFGLRMRGVARPEIAERVKAALEQVKLEGLDARYPAQLSGGQQQRVALARAIVIRPPVLLCDEPLGALDRKLRHQMQFELKDLQRQLGVTLVFVTHDQEEALSMSDRIAIMNAGRIEQVGTPTEIYERPRTRFVADFIGDINVFEGRWQDGRFLLPDGRAIPAPAAERSRGAAGLVAIRPEKLRAVAPADGAIAGRIETTNYLGGQTLYRVETDGRGAILFKQDNRAGEPTYPPGTQIGLTWHDEDAVNLETEPDHALPT